MYKLKSKVTGKFLNWNLIESKPTTEPIKKDEVVELEAFVDETTADDFIFQYNIEKCVIVEVFE